MSRSAKSFPWFRLYDADWDADTVATLDLATQGLLLIVQRRMLSQMSPISRDVINMLARPHGNKTTVGRMIRELIDRGLIYEAGAGFWCDVAEREFVNRGIVSENISEKNRNISRKRWQKDEQNQSISVPEGDKEKKGGAPAGRAPSSDHVSPKEGEDGSVALNTASSHGAAVQATYQGEADPHEFLKSIKRSTVISFTSPKARLRLIEFMASSSDDPGIAAKALRELFDRDELSKGSAIKVLRAIWEDHRGGKYAKGA